jgi:hypothetical protein
LYAAIRDILFLQKTGKKDRGSGMIG